MSTLCFFPWLELKRDVAVRDVRLLQYRRGRRPGPPHQGPIDTITEPYVLTPRAATRSATILTVGSRDLLDDIDQSAVPAQFEVANLVTAAALSSRTFFGMNYWNRDNFTFFVQRFEKPDRGVLFEARRLDGTTGVYVPHENLIVARPVHAGIGAAEIDEPLLNALLQLRDDEEWPRFREAIQSFSFASTDNPEIPIELAIVLVNGAIEQILDARPKSEDVIDKLERALVPASTLELKDCEVRVGKLPRGRTPIGTVRGAWIRDLFALRGDLAHGRLSARYAGAWRPREHLLMASFCFPLLLKLALERKGLYSLTSDDRDSIDAFEALACAEHLSGRTEDDWDEASSWSDILTEIGFGRIVEKWNVELEQEKSGTSEDDASTGV